MSEFYFAGLTSQSVTIGIANSTGSDQTGLAYNTAGLAIYYRIGAAGAFVQMSLATQTPTGAWTSGGFCELDSTKAPGAYRLDLPNVVVGTSDIVTIFVTGTGLLSTKLRVDCRPLPVDLKAIMGSLLTGVGSQIAAAFSYVFNVANATFTAASTNQTGDSFNRIGANGASLTSLATASNLTALSNSLASDNTALSNQIGSPMQAGATVSTTPNSVENQIWGKVQNLPADPTSETNATANKTTIVGAIPALTAIVSGVWNALVSNLTGAGTIGAFITALTSGAGDGDNSVTITVQDTSGNPLQLANVTAKIGGQTKSTLLTDVNGQAVLKVANATYSIIVTCNGFNGAVETLVVSGDASPPAYQLSPIVGNPSTSGQGTGYVYYPGMCGNKLRLVNGDTFGADRPLMTNIINQDWLIGCVAHLRFEGSDDDIATSEEVTSGTQQVVFNPVSADATDGIKTGRSVGYQVRYEKDGEVMTVITTAAEVVGGL